LRRAFSQFLEHLPRKPRVAVGGGRQQTAGDFRSGVRDLPDATHVLLLDSECAHSASDSCKAKIIAEFGRDRIDHLGEDHFHFMVQMMEAWLIADPNAVQQAFPQDADVEEIKELTNVESISKERLMEMIEKASGGKYVERKKREYGPRILERANHDVVAGKADHCRRFVEKMDNFSR
jgi:hypothetical protein